MRRHIQARTSTEAFWTLDPFVLVEPGDPWFLDLEDLLPREHYGVSHRLRRQLEASPARPEFVHLALLGDAGVGKATLVRNVIASLSSDGLAPVYVDSQRALDQADFTFSDIMLVAAEAVIGELVELELEVGRAELEVVWQWLAEELVDEAHRAPLFGNVAGAIEGEASIPAVARLAAKIAAALKADHEYRTEIRKRAERDPRALIRRVNLLLDAVHAAIKPRRLCVVFENLEKLDLELIDRSLLQRADEFRQLRCDTLLFANPASEYAPVGVQLSKAFPRVTVPALPVRHSGDAPYVVRPEATAAIERLLGQRVVLDAVSTSRPPASRRLPTGPAGICAASY